MTPQPTEEMTPTVGADVFGGGLQTTDKQTGQDGSGLTWEQSAGRSGVSWKSELSANEDHLLLSGISLKK